MSANAVAVGTLRVLVCGEFGFHRWPELSLVVLQGREFSRGGFSSMAI